jgi:hypothetical protein
MKRGRLRTAEVRQGDAGSGGVRFRDDAEVVCPSGLFERAEPEITRLTAAIAQASGLKEKAACAATLAAAASDLLACGQHSADNLNCTLCRRLSMLRCETAALVNKMAGGVV